MWEDRVYSFIGLARKAGSVAPGEMACENALKYGKAQLVIISSDASSNTQKRMAQLCGAKEVNWVLFGTKSKMGEALGREMFSVIAITDRRFSERLMELIKNNSDHAN